MTTCRRHTLTFLIFLHTCHGFTWNNHLYEDWTVQCPNNHVIREIVSVHRCGDRYWNITCGPVDPFISLTECTWSRHVITNHTDTFFQCPKNSLLSGISSFIETTDRTYKFYCCMDENYAAHGCEYTSSLNSPRSMISFQVPDLMYLRGWHTLHDVSSHDNIYVAHVCKLSKIGPPELCPIRDLAVKLPAVDQVNVTTVPMVEDTDSTTAPVF
ncbi:hypothetical protein Btru_063755 [Bulinus truncatus]|nr:hypothetical protein Btru_063755 [Bulinus truncatus]